MAEVLDVEISKSIDVVHVGDEFLMYVTIRNKFVSPITRIGVSYDLPKGFFIRVEQDDNALQNPQPAQGWSSSMAQAFQNYFYIPSLPLTVFDSKRTMSWQTDTLPGESYTITIPIRAGAFFPPALQQDTYHLMFEIKYVFDNQEHIFQAKTDLIVYPHAGNIYLGSIFGGITGAFLRTPTFSTHLALNLFLGAITGLVLAVVFRRKANVQSFIAVEDFWGGFLTGVIASYGGHDTLNRFLAPGTGTTST